MHIMHNWRSKRNLIILWIRFYFQVQVNFFPSLAAFFPIDIGLHSNKVPLSAIFVNCKINFRFVCMMKHTATTTGYRGRWKGSAKGITKKKMKKSLEWRWCLWIQFCFIHWIKFSSLCTWFVVHAEQFMGILRLTKLRVAGKSCRHHCRLLDKSRKIKQSNEFYTHYAIMLITFNAAHNSFFKVQWKKHFLILKKYFLSFLASTSQNY